MVSLNYCLSINKLSIVASTLPNSTSSSSPSLPHQASASKPSHPTINTANTPITSQPPSLPKLKQRKKQKQPSILEIERAIGAGIFRDKDPIRESEEKKSLFDTIFSTEGSVEKQLRETGEWITDKTEDKFRSADWQEFEDTCIQVGKGFDGKSIQYQGNFLSAENITRRGSQF